MHERVKAKSLSVARYIEEVGFWSPRNLDNKVPIKFLPFWGVQECP